MQTLQGNLERLDDVLENKIDRVFSHPTSTQTATEQEKTKGSLAAFPDFRLAGVTDMTIPRPVITNSVDSETERTIDQNWRRRSCTCLIVAHRLSTTRNADRIYVIKASRVVQQG